MDLFQKIRKGSQTLKLDFESIKKDLIVKYESSNKNDGQDNSRLSSSVIMPLYHTEDSTGMILTTRSKKLKSHPGQISFPGGVQEANESILQTGLREWEEEMGAPSRHLDILGSYEQIDTRTGYHITPFVGIYKGDFQFNINEEVESWMNVTIQDFWAKDFYCVDFFGMKSHRVYYFDLEEKGLLWGATCDIIVRFLREFAQFDREPKLVEPNLSNPPFFRPQTQVQM